MIATLALASFVGVGVGTTLMNFTNKGSHTLEGKIALIFKRCDIAIECKESTIRKKLYPKLVKQGWEGNNKKFYFKLPAGMTYLDVISKMPNFWDGLNAEVIPKKLEGDYKSDFTLTVLSGHLKDMVEFNLEEMLKAIKHKKGELIIPIGISRRKFETVTLSSDKTSTMLIGGMIGSGKSTLIRQILVAIHLGYTPEEVELWLCDMKENVEFSIVGNSKFVGNKVSSPFEALGFFQELLEVTQERYRILKNYNCTDINQFNKNYPHMFMKRILLLIDEYAMLEGSKDPDENKYYSACRMLVKQIVAISRASGVHTLLSTQRPSNEVLEGTLKNNLSSTCGFRMKNEVSSRILIDDPRLAHIDPDKPGRCILRTDRDVYVQVPYIDGDSAYKILTPFRCETINLDDLQTPNYTKST